MVQADYPENILVRLSMAVISVVECIRIDQYLPQPMIFLIMEPEDGDCHIRRHQPPNRLFALRTNARDLNLGESLEKRHARTENLLPMGKACVVSPPCA